MIFCFNLVTFWILFLEIRKFLVIFVFHKTNLQLGCSTIFVFNSKIIKFQNQIFKKLLHRTRCGNNFVEPSHLLDDVVSVLARRLSSSLEEKVDWSETSFFALYAHTTYNSLIHTRIWTRRHIEQQLAAREMLLLLLLLLLKRYFTLLNTRIPK